MAQTDLARRRPVSKQNDGSFQRVLSLESRELVARLRTALSELGRHLP